MISPCPRKEQKKAPKLWEIQTQVDQKRSQSPHRKSNGMEKYPLKGSKSIALNPLVGGGGGSGDGSAILGSTIGGGTSYQSVTRKVCLHLRSI